MKNPMTRHPIPPPTQLKLRRSRAAPFATASIQKGPALLPPLARCHRRGYGLRVSGKSEKVQRLLSGLHAGELDPRYAGYFVCFNRGEYFEAHDVLEELWLEDRHGADGDFFKGLIQLAGAFVHLQKDRPGPAAALLLLAVNNLGRYPSPHRHLEVRGVTDLAGDWRQRLIAGEFTVNPLFPENAPRLDQFLAPEVRPGGRPGIQV